MIMTHPENFELLQPRSSGCWYSEFQVKLLPSGLKQRLLRFESGTSTSQEFRAAFRKDLPTLQNIRHGNILSVTGWGESDGKLFYLTDLPDGKALNELLSPGRFSWDEVTDIGWQIASALQHAHNIGIVHGGLNADCVIVSDQIRVQVTGFGVQRWIDAADADSDRTIVPDPAIDLRDFGRILQELIGQMSTSDAATQREPMQQLVDELQLPDALLIARDVQGRLGNMLLNESGDAIEMVDDRKGQNLSRRSLIDELFDEPGKLPPPRQYRLEKTQATEISLAAVAFLCMAALILLAIAAWLLR